MNAAFHELGMVRPAEGETEEEPDPRDEGQGEDTEQLPLQHRLRRSGKRSHADIQLLQRQHAHPAGEQTMDIGLRITVEDGRPKRKSAWLLPG